MKYLTTIGLEVHVQLRTKTKMFCACPLEYGATANTHTCPTCLGLPGGLPAINEEAVNLTVRTGLMLRCQIAPVSRFDRKNYFYPDSAKNYQISQYEQPLCLGGELTISDPAYPKEEQGRPGRSARTIPLARIHLEEDVAKSIHFETNTGIDFNRAGAPLMEIVTQPEIRSPEEAFAFLTTLRQILIYGGVSDADMEKGQLRCDANISVRPESQVELNQKVEIKNLNSIGGARRALAFELARQTMALGRKESLRQETRGWDGDRGETSLLRTKESEHDYRYFPEPDLPPFETAVFIAGTQVPELPEEKRERFVRQFGVTIYDAEVLTGDLELASYFEEAALRSAQPKALANWILNDLLSALAATGRRMADAPFPGSSLDELIRLVEAGKISGKQAKEVFSEMFATGRGAGEIVAEKNIEQLSDVSSLEKLCDEAIATNPKSVAAYRSGQHAALNYLKGQVMKLSKGKANPRLVGELLERKLRADGGKSL